MNWSSRRTASVLASAAATLSLLAVPAGASASFDIKLKAWWPLAEGRGQTVYDWSGHGNHGTLGSTRGADDNDPSWIRGIFWGSALRFDGNDFIKIDNSNDLEPAKFTVSLWTRAPQSPGPFSYLISKGSKDCVTGSWGISTGNNGGLQSYVWDGQNQVPSGGAQPEQIWDGRWHNVAMTYDGTSTRLYLDGKDLGQPPGSSSPVDYDMPDPSTTLGGYVGSCDLLFTGDLDQVMVFGNVLPIEEIWDRWGYILGRPGLG